MWDRFLFTLRERVLDAGLWLGSWKLSIVLMVLAGLYYAFLAIWARSSPPEVVRNIASLLPFWIVYALILLNTAVCLWNRFGLLKRQVSSEPFLDQGPSDWELETTSIAEKAATLLRKLRFEPQPHGDGGLWAVRHRWSALGTYLFHGAFALVAAGFLLTLGTRSEARVWVAVGEEFTGAPEQFLSQSPPRMLSLGLLPMRFRVDDLRPELWRDELLFTNLEAELVLEDGARATTRINRPVWWSWSTFLRLSGFGYAPRFQVEDRRGQLLDSAFVKLDVFPPGQRDSFEIDGLPHRFYVSVLPDFVEEAGELRTRTLNLVEPAVLLNVWRGHVDLGGDVLQKADRYQFEGLQLAFPEIRYWGEFAIVRDPGAPWIFLGYALGLFGLLLKLGGRRQEITWSKDGTLRGWGVPQPAVGD